MTVRIPPDFQAFVQSAISSGTYADENAVVIAALHLLREREWRLAALKRELAPALERLDRGEGKELKGDAELAEFFEGIKREGRERLAQEKQAE